MYCIYSTSTPDSTCFRISKRFSKKFVPGVFRAADHEFDNLATILRILRMVVRWGIRSESKSAKSKIFIKGYQVFFLSKKKFSKSWHFRGISWYWCLDHTATTKWLPNLWSTIRKSTIRKFITGTGMNFFENRKFSKNGGGWRVVPIVPTQPPLLYLLHIAYRPLPNFWLLYFIHIKCRA